MLRGLIFDKDGTLFDFAGTWNSWAEGVIADLARGDAAQAALLAGALRFDLARGGFDPDSPVIAGTNREAAELLLAHLPGRSLTEVETYLAEAAAEAPLVPATPLAPLMQHLSGDLGLHLGVMTNDSEFSARRQLRAAGVEGFFPFLAGFDSGHGAKPDAAPLLAFAQQTGLPPAQVGMVGDSTHDMLAGRAAGMICIAVLTGLAPAEELAPHAHVVLPDISHLPEWLHASR
ncbi:HAD family hydrolase [Pseudooceanicola sp. 200-1SW]|uniref:HAD family hydrolase n=1 Tax=Pseudooceanicola sp. 200-1SW TaxID=3425949 RepID=UPI003D7FDAA7